MKYNKALDLILAATLKFKKGDGAEAASFLQKAVASDDFDEAVDTLDGMGEDNMDEEASVTAAFANATKRLVKADANDVAPVSTENLGDGDLPASPEGANDTPELRGEKAVEARLARASRNQARLAARK